jgi:predicted polyphosphate/ATP-dependent NAD kinase
LATVGIIANPVSGKDIRRLVAHGSVFDNQEKVRIVRRILTGLAATGVERVVFMPDAYGIVPRALRSCALAREPEPLAMTIANSQNDSTRAARLMAETGVALIIVLGGDGTCRAVAKGSAEVPLLPISTGTNNVFPYMIEATVGGMAAGLASMGRVPRSEALYRSCRLEILNDGKVIDIALVDVAVYNDRFVAARAIWDMEKVSQVFLTRARPDAIGLSSIGGQLVTITPQEARGLHLVLGRGGLRRVTAPIGPGLLQAVCIRKQEIMALGQPLPVESAPCVLALDGEREVTVKQDQAVFVSLSNRGPWVMDVPKTMAFAQQHGLLVQAEQAPGVFDN